VQIRFRRNCENGRRIIGMLIFADKKEERAIIKKLKESVKKGYGVGAIISERMYLCPYSAINGKAQIDENLFRVIEPETAPALRRFLGQPLAAKKIKRYEGKKLDYGGIVLTRGVRKRRAGGLFSFFLSFLLKGKNKNQTKVCKTAAA